MTSSYSSDLKLELMVTGENAGTWGDNTNNNLNLIQQAIAGFEQVTLSSGGTLALVMTDKTISNARNMVIKFATASIAASTICTIPDSIEKFYIFDATGLTNPANLTIKTASGTGFTLDQAKIYAAYSDGTNLNEISLDTLGGTVAAANITGTISTSQIADDAVTFAKMQDTTTNNRVLGAASAGTIGEVQVATDMIADDAVTADKLANTSVTAGSYTASSITVDAQGRLTAASSGSGGAGGLSVKILSTGPASGNIATNSSASKFSAYAYSGGGGGGGAARDWTRDGAPGGAGAFGYYEGAIAGSTTYAYAVGAPGNGGPASPSGGTAGGDGGDTNVGNLFIVNGGNGGGAASMGSSNNQTGTSGNAPGTTLTYSKGIVFEDTPYSNLGQRAFGGQGGNNPANPQNQQIPGQAGGKGFLAFYINDLA